MLLLTPLMVGDLGTPELAVLLILLLAALVALVVILRRDRRH